MCQEFQRYTNTFKNYLGPDGKPPSGKQWLDVLEEFRKDLFEEEV